VLDPDFDFEADRIKVSITEDDPASVQGPSSEEEGAIQTALIETMDGKLVAGGKLLDDDCAELEKPGGGSVWIERLEVGGQHLGYFASERLEPGARYPVVYASAVDPVPVEDPGPPAQDLDAVPGFGPATSLDTLEGPVPVEWLNPNIQVNTLDHDMVQLIWSGSVPFSHMSDRGQDGDWPIQIPANAIEPGVPTEPVTLSPGHRVLIRHPFCDLYFGHPEIFVAAERLLGLNGIRRIRPGREFQYHYVLMPEHEVVTTHGLQCESLFYCEETVKLLDPASQRAVLKAARNRPYHTQTARPCLNDEEADVLREALSWPVAEDHAKRSA
jgi:hypothetical protein